MNEKSKWYSPSYLSVSRHLIVLNTYHSIFPPCHPDEEPRVFRGDEEGSRRSEYQPYEKPFLDPIIQILPFRVHGFNKCNFLFSAPPFDFFFPVYGILCILKMLIPNQYIQVIPACKPFDQFIFMLPRAVFQMICHTGIGNAMLFIRHDVG
jgi:hypothetical protein